MVTAGQMTVAPAPCGDAPVPPESALTADGSPRSLTTLLASIHRLVSA